MKHLPNFLNSKWNCFMEIFLSQEKSRASTATFWRISLHAKDCWQLKHSWYLFHDCVIIATHQWNIFWFIVLGSKPGVAIKRFGQLSNGPRSCRTHGIHASIPCSLVTHRPCDSEPVWGYVRTAGTRRRFDRYEFTWHHSTNVGPRRSSSAYHCSSQGSSPSNNSATPEELAHLLASPLESARIWL